MKLAKWIFVTHSPIGQQFACPKQHHELAIYEQVFKLYSAHTLDMDPMANMRVTRQHSIDIVTCQADDISAIKQWK